MRRVDDEHRVKLEPHARTRLDVANARQEQRGERLLIGEAFPDSGGDFFE